MAYRWCLPALILWSMASGVRAELATADVTYAERSLGVRAYWPDGLDVIRGVLVFTGGQASGGSGDTRAVVEQRFFQRFAESTGFALLGNQFTGSYTDASNGPGQALLDALAALGDKTGHPELAHAPLLLHGFSNGGYFS
ncbi:MAG TPA: hypothetical protein VJR89_38670, partial [Polyangiales bacterium]|nr:hypothetical protein [Polyangiales bacterium]